MAVKDSEGASPAGSTPTDDGLIEVLDEEDGLELVDRGHRRERWPANDFY